MKDTNHLPIDKALKKNLNNKLKEFRKNRFSQGVVASSGNKKKAFLDILFDEHNSIGDLMKSLF